MLKRKCLLSCVAVVAIAALLTASEVLAGGSSGGQTCLSSQVKCGAVCLDIFPTATDNPNGSCTYQWNVFNAGTSAQVAIGYECSDPTKATNANGCGVGNNFAFKGIFQLDSVTITPNPNCSTAPNCQRIGYTINSSCAQRGSNDVIFKFGNVPTTCNGPIEGYGTTNTFETTVSDTTQALGDSGCEITTTFVRGAGNRVIDYTVSLTTNPGNTCTITQNKVPLSSFPGSPTNVPDGTVIKFGQESCYSYTYNGKLTWVSSGGSICPPR